MYFNFCNITNYWQQLKVLLHALQLDAGEDFSQWAPHQEFFRQENWNWVCLHNSGYLSTQELNPQLLLLLSWQADSCH